MNRSKIINFCIYSVIIAGILYIGFWQGSFQATVEHITMGY